MLIYFLVDPLRLWLLCVVRSCTWNIFNTLPKDLHDKIWKLKQELNVITKEEFKSAAFDKDMQEGQEMAEIG